jgi:hypothetical protein
MNGYGGLLPLFFILVLMVPIEQYMQLDPWGVLRNDFSEDFQAFSPYILEGVRHPCVGYRL